MICPKCGAPIAEGTTFCANCGTNLAVNPQQYAQPQQQYAQPQQQYAQPQQQYAQPQQQYAQPQQQYAQPQQQYAQPQQQYAQPQQQYAQPQQQYAQPQQQYAQPQQSYGQPQYGQPQYAMPYGGMAPAKKSHVGLIIGICAGAAVLIAGIVILIILLAGGGGGVSGKDYKTSIVLDGATESFSGTYSGGWKDEKPEGNGTLNFTMTKYSIEFTGTINGNWKSGKLDGGNCTLTFKGESSGATEDDVITGSFKEGELIDGSFTQTGSYSDGSKTIYTITYKDGKATESTSKSYDKDGKEITN